MSNVTVVFDIYPINKKYNGIVASVLTCHIKELGMVILRQLHTHVFYFLQGLTNIFTPGTFVITQHRDRPSF